MDELKNKLLSEIYNITNEEGKEVNIEHLKIMSNLGKIALHNYKSKSDIDLINEYLNDCKSSEENDSYEEFLKGLNQAQDNYREFCTKFIHVLLKHCFNGDELISLVNEVNKVNEIFNIIDEFYFQYLKLSYIALNDKSKLMPKIDRIKKGKSPKSKKPEQLKAEEFAKDIWEKDSNITQENMACQLKDKLELTQSIQTIIRWIKPFQPKK